MTSNVSKLMAGELRKAPQVALFSHVSPDGDCTGSMLALGLALKKMGKKVYLYNPDRIPHYLDFLPGVSEIQHVLPDPLPQLLCFVDCTDLNRVNLDPKELRQETVILNLDHHVSNQNFGTINWVEPSAAASGEIVMALIQELGVSLDGEIATNLYTALATDTGSFQYSNTTAQTHRLAAELLECGIDLQQIHHRLFNQKPLAQLKLLQKGLASLELYAEGQFAVMSLTQHDFAEAGAEESLSEGVINHARTIEGVEVAVIFKEIEPQKIRIGFRSNLWFNVNEVAARFGGGGHVRAAGCTMNTTLRAAKELVIRAIEEDLALGRSH